MKVWKVSPLYLGKITGGLDLVWPRMLPSPAERIVFSSPYLGFLLQDGQRNIVVDTGISEKYIVNGLAWGSLPAEGGQQFMLDALEKHGLQPADIDLVLFTHLHNDHAANSHIFSKATFVFQDEEWTNALRPLPSQLAKGDYDPNIVEEVLRMKRLMVHGDLQIDDGLKLLHTPGHTAGSQSVIVNTHKGVIAIVGDLCLMDFMAFPDAGVLTDMNGTIYRIPTADPKVVGPAIPHGIIYDHYAFYSSINRVKSVISRDEPGYIVTGHDASVLVRGL
ncbi:MAG TPA: N-acyl homoserine lactonase family protein [Steroidobacter sp.]|uniref:N-acyl homoserine lactonase family protein n=1 Tax=Steroidobacter sp. TaxID=1978227 RepID=UPI002EDA88BF